MPKLRTGWLIVSPSIVVIQSPSCAPNFIKGLPAARCLMQSAGISPRTFQRSVPQRASIAGFASIKFLNAEKFTRAVIAPPDVCSTETTSGMTGIFSPEGFTSVAVFFSFCTSRMTFSIFLSVAYSRNTTTPPAKRIRARQIVRSVRSFTGAKVRFGNLLDAAICFYLST